MDARVTSDDRNYYGILTTNIMVVESREGRWRQHYFIYLFIFKTVQLCLSAALSEAQQRMKVMWAEIL